MNTEFPANIEAEESILGGILLDPQALAIVLPLLDPEAFSVQEHKMIYRVALSLFEAGKATDLMMVTEYLYKNGQIHKVGGKSKLAQLINCTVSAVNIDQFAHLVMEKYQTRLAMQLGIDLHSQKISIQEGLAKLEKISQIHQVKEPATKLEEQLRDLSQTTNRIEYKIKLKEICRQTGLPKKDIEEEVANLYTLTATQKIERIRCADFIKQEEADVKWIFPGLLPSIGVSLWAGDPGAGKTTLAIDAAVSIAMGEEFMGEMPTKKGRVLIVCSDENTRYTREKLIDRGVSEDAEIEILKNWHTAHWVELEKAIADFHPTAVIIDCFASIHKDGSFDENSAQAKATVYRLEAISDAYQCAIVLLHHLNKNQKAKGLARIRGNTAIAAACTVVAIFEKSASGNGRNLTFHKMRGNDYPGAYGVELNHETGQYKVRSGGITQQENRLSQKLLGLFKSFPTKGFSFVEIRNAFSADVENLRKTINRLVQRGQLVRQKSLTDGRFNMWGLPQAVLDIISPPNPTETNCPILETEPEQSFQVVDTIVDTTPEIVDTIEVSNNEMPSGLGFQVVDIIEDTPPEIVDTIEVSNNEMPSGLGSLVVDTQKGQGEDCVNSILSSTEIKWVLQLLADMEISIKFGGLNPRFVG